MMPMHRDGFEPGVDTSLGGDNPHTPASEPARSQPPSPQKKKRKVSRSQSISALPKTNISSGFFPPPNVYASPHDPMVAPHPYDDPMHVPGMPMSGQLMHMVGSPMGNPGHPMMHPGGPPHGAPMHPHMQTGPSVPMHMHGHPGNGGPPPPHHMMSAASHANRYMRQGSAPAPSMPPHPHMHPQSPHMHSPAGMNAPPMSSHMGHPGVQPYSPGMSTMSAGRVYPTDQPMIFNQSNPHAPPIYPCGSCHKEVSDSDQAILCESGCNFWFHRQCTGLTEQAFQLLTKEVYAEWVCDQCLRKKNIPLIKLKP